MTPSFQQLLPLLAEHEVRFIIIGGIAGMAHGAARATYDIDVVYARDPENVKQLVAALRPHQPYLRGAPPGLPFTWDELPFRAERSIAFSTWIY